MKSIQNKVGSFLVICSLLIGGLTQPAFAQEAGHIVFSNLDASRFPTVSFNLEAYGADGRFRTDLQPADLQLTEDNLPVKLEELSLVEPGLELVVALNVGPAMALQTAGENRYERIRNQLVNWANSLTANGSDEISLATLTGLQLIRASQPADLAKALLEYNPELIRAQSNLGALSQAVDLASNPSRSLMKGAVLYITAPQPASSLAAIQNLADRAASRGVAVSVWYVPPTNIPVPAEEAVLMELASKTGGSYLVFTGKEDLPGPEDYFQPLRYVYQGSYTARANTSGEHIVTLQPADETLGLTPLEQRYTVQVEPPNPIFLSPPTQVIQQWSGGTEAVAAVLVPDRLEIKILVEFPDGHTRPLAASRLLVDGAVVDEHTSAPFDRLEWTIGHLDTSGTHRLQVEVVDTLGLSRRSIETPVEVLVPVQQGKTLPGGISLERVLIGGGVLVLGIGLVVLILLLNRRRHHHRRRAAAAPVRTQPISPEMLASSVSPSWPRQRSGAPSPARLIRISESGHTVAGSSIALSRPEITFGSDPQQAMVVIDHPSVDALHARLVQSGPDYFILYDCNSLAGTWVNYQPIPAAGVQLTHEDLIQMGGITYRFEVNRPSKQRTLQVQKVEDLL